MKKLFTLTFMFVLSCAMSFAQSKFEFVDGSGNVIPNGTVYNASGAFDDWGGMYEIGSGIYIKGNGSVNFSVKITKVLEGMDILSCAGGTCSPVNPGDVVSKDLSINSSKNEDIETHCSYSDGVSGTCEVELTLTEGGNVCSKITLVFTTHDLAGIDSVIAGDTICNIYDITGKLVKANVSKNAVNAMTKGLYIVRELTGAKNVNKVIVK